MLCLDSGKSREKNNAGRFNYEKEDQASKCHFPSIVASIKTQLRNAVGYIYDKQQTTSSLLKTIFHEGQIRREIERSIPIRIPAHFTTKFNQTKNTQKINNSNK